jgi:chromosomal replication initiator protein
MDTHKIWQSVLGELELTLSKANFTMWFKGTHIISYENRKIVVGVPNTFAKSWFEHKYKKNIYDILDKVTNHDIKELEFKVQPKREAKSINATPTAQAPQPKKEKETPAVTQKPKEVQTPEPVIQNDVPEPKQEKKEIQDVPQAKTFNPNTRHIPNVLSEFRLNDKYIFENFIVGKCNELANAASRAVAENPGRAYNPLFIYGDVGLGKTHLLQAVGNHIQQINPDARILYVSCEKFTSDFIRAIATKQLNEFKNTYRNVDVLLMDDVQFLAGKESTQEEFFHTFNALHQNNSQVVVTSDRPPKAIPDLEERLLSRFEWGMIADISTLDLETRMAIIQQKTQEKGIILDHETSEYVARAINNNVRELEGALNRIKAFTQLRNVMPTLENIKSILSTINGLQRGEPLSPAKIIRVTAEYYSIEKSDLLGKSREKRLVHPRQLCMQLMREELEMSYPAIGKELGGRDHTTAMHACQKITKQLETNEQLQAEYQRLKQKVLT